MADKNVIGEQLAEILNDFEHELDETVKREITSTAKEAVQKLRSSSPKSPGGGSYARGWTVKKDRDGSAIVHNKVYYLTHLLENGHVIRNARGTYGRTNGIKHIEPVEQWANGELVDRIEKDITRGLI